MKLAIFDLDNTLLPIDSDHSWGQFCVQKGWVDRGVFEVRNRAFFADYQARCLDVNAYLAFSYQLLDPATLSEQIVMQKTYMEEVIAPNIQAHVLEFLKTYRDAGWQMLLATATNIFIASPIADMLGFKDLVATDLVRKPDGSFTTKPKGIISLGQGKLQKTTEWLKTKGLSWDDLTHSTMLSDSMNDLPLLEQVQEPVAVNPAPELRQLAQYRGWRILDLFT
jgi:HAD superfamily hydrolase (TIGR01490 family)